MSKRILKRIIYLFLLWFGIHQITIITDGLTDENTKTDVAVIYGNTVHEDGIISYHGYKHFIKNPIRLLTNGILNFLKSDSYLLNPLV